MSITVSTGSYQLAAESITGTPPTCTTTFVNVAGDMGLIQYASSHFSDFGYNDVVSESEWDRYDSCHRWSPDKLQSRSHASEWDRNQDR